MADPSLFDAIRIPGAVLVALDNRTFHFALQPWHYIVRMAHILSMALFFGGIVILDFRLVGIGRRRPIESTVGALLPSVYAGFVIAIVTGIALFLYDPVHVGAHAYFTPKLLLTALGLANAVIYHRLGLSRAMSGEGGLPVHTRIAGIASLLIWSAVMICAALNVEGVPKVLLR